jgi:hypothetical protein
MKPAAREVEATFLWSVIAIIATGAFRLKS